MKNQRVAGLSMKGGRNDNFFFCLLDFHAESDRWYLKSLLQLDDEDDVDTGDDAIRSWINSFKIKNLVLDFPLTKPPCHECVMDCPGISSCPVDEVQFVVGESTEILLKDQRLRHSHPKEYERARNEDDLFDYSKDVFDKWPLDQMLSRSFKRRLKKGFLPYWNRPLDFWVWCFYHDQLLSLFKSTFDSFGNTSLMMLSRFHYLKNHFPQDLQLFEGNVNLALIELIRGKILLKKNITLMSDIEFGVDARLDIIKKIEAKLNIFMYEKDLDIIVKNPRAFDSFILAIIGQRRLLGEWVELPAWTKPKSTNFILPTF